MHNSDAHTQTAELVRQILAEESLKVSRTYRDDGSVIKTTQEWVVKPGHSMKVEHFDLGGETPVFTHTRHGAPGSFDDLFSELFGSYEDDVRLNKSYRGELNLPEGYRTAPSGLILPVSEFSAPPNNLHSANSRANWRAWMRNAAAKLIIGIGWAVPILLFLVFIVSMVIWKEQVFGPIVDYLFRPGTTPLTHQDLIILMCGSVIVIALIWVFRMLGLALVALIREAHLLSWGVRDPSRFTPEVISNLRATLRKQSNLTVAAAP